MYKNQRHRLEEILKAKFRMPQANMTQWKDQHITIDVFGGDVQVWNNLNMRYCHKRFRSDRDAMEAYKDAADWLENEYNGQAQPVPEQWAEKQEQ